MKIYKLDTASDFEKLNLCLAIGNFDGIHLRGKFAVQHMTRTFINMIINIFPHLKPQHLKSYNTINK